MYQPLIEGSPVVVGRCNMTAPPCERPVVGIIMSSTTISLAKEAAPHVFHDPACDRHFADYVQRGGRYTGRGLNEAEARFFGKVTPRSAEQVLESIKALIAEAGI